MSISFTDAPVSLELRLFSFIRANKAAIAACLNANHDHGQGDWWKDLLENMEVFERYYRGAQHHLRGDAAEAPEMWVKDSLARKTRAIGIQLLLSRSTLKNEPAFEILYESLIDPQSDGARLLVNDFIKRNISELRAREAARTNHGGELQASWEPDRAVAGRGVMTLTFARGRARKEASRAFSHLQGEGPWLLGRWFDQIVEMWRDIQSFAENEMRELSAADQATIRAHGWQIINAGNLV